uniref:Uncharacterized protein n=1 Tax=Homo sapiens TaxID=9606 RepID=A0AAG2TVH3_HUMAN
MKPRQKEQDTRLRKLRESSEGDQWLENEKTKPLRPQQQPQCQPAGGTGQRRGSGSSPSADQQGAQDREEEAAAAPAPNQQRAQDREEEAAAAP